MSFSVTPSAKTVDEDVGTITFTVKRTTTSIAETVYFSTAQNQGFANIGDYIGHLNTPLNFGVGVSTLTITVNVTNDSQTEVAEKFGIILDTANGTVLDTSTFTITDDDAPAASTFTMTPASTTVGENAGSLTFTISRSSSAGSETIYFSTVQNQGFSNNGDYTGQADTAVTFAAGQTIKTVTVNITDDTVGEGTEKFSALIESASGTDLDSSVFTITDNDQVAPSTFTMTPAATTVSEGVGSVAFTISRTSSAMSETVYFSTVQNQGFTNNADYTGRADTAVTFDPGQLSKTVSVAITNDAVAEGTETFAAVIESAAGTSLDTSTFTITDNDQSTPQTFTMTPAATTVAENVGSVAFTITRSSSAGTATVYFSTIQNQGSANNGDYTGRADFAITFAAGEASKVVAVNITNDTIAEGTETFGALIETASGTTLDTSTFTITDNDGGTPPPPTGSWSRPVGLSFFPVPATPRVTQGFGGDTSHNVQKYAVDLSAASGTTVKALGNGTVIGVRTGSTSGDTAEGGFGNYVTIQQANGLIVTYAHLSSVQVALNQSVTANSSVLGLSGNTGFVEAAHLHLTFGTRSTGTVGMLRADGSAATGSPAFFLSHFTSNLEHGGLIDPANASSLRSTDIFGTSQATMSNGSAFPNADQDELVGGSAANRMFGGSGNDRMRGDGGNDLLVGGTGNDTMAGGTDRDTLVGGQGQDQMTGNAGSDAFLYRARLEIGDFILDFSSADDEFQFTASSFNNLAPGVLSSANFRSGTTNSAVDSNDYFIFRTSDHTLWFDPDGNGSANALLVADLQSGAVVSASDIYIVA